MAKKEAGKKDAVKKDVKKESKKEPEVVEREVFTKDDLVDVIADVHECSKAFAKSVVGTVFETITGALAEDKNVQIYGFGQLNITDVPARQVRNPKTGEMIDAEATKRVSIKLSQTVKKSVKA